LETAGSYKISGFVVPGQQAASHVAIVATLAATFTAAAAAVRAAMATVCAAMAAYLLPSCCLVLMQRLHSRIQQISLATW